MHSVKPDKGIFREKFLIQISDKFNIIMSSIKFESL